MPLDQVAARRDGDDDAGPDVRSELSPQVFAERFGAALREITKQIPPLPKDPAQQPRRGKDYVTMRNWREHFLLQPLRL